MKCLNCAYQNPEDARFCQNCGKPLERACPVCGTTNSLQARFCKNCGSSLQNEPAVAPVSKAASTASTEGPLPPPKTAPVEVSPAAPRHTEHAPGERRVVTALFADVVGSTALSEGMDPEDWTAVMNRAYELLMPVIYHYGGTVARLMGDALLAFFGAPVAHEDDPRRAAHAALEMIDTAGRFSAELRELYGIEFAIRVGLNTGMAVVGEVGSNLASEYTAMGDAVNLASRVQAAAKPMSVYITGQTYRLLAAEFECVDLGTIPVRGKSEPVQMYELLKPKPASAKAMRSAMVGRDAELSVLLRASEAVMAGLGRVVLVVGDPGIGKTRLVSEWKTYLTAANELSPALRWAEGHTLSYGQGMAYHLVIDLLRSLIGIPPGSDEPATRAALQQVSESLFGEDALEISPYLGHLLSIQQDAAALERVRQLDPQALNSQYLTSLRELLRAIASRAPLVLLLEDIHWADPSSVEMLARLIPLSIEAPILFCLVTRPERDAPGWKLVTQAREQLGASLIKIELSALADTDAQQMVTNLLQTDALPVEVRSLVLARAEGNPLFVEEVIRMLLDRKLIEKTETGWHVARDIENVEIPDNLQSLLLARIDRLPEDVKRTLRIAAVIGRQFPIRVLQEVLKRQGSAL